MQDDENEDFESYPIAYSIDNAILMHRDAHFGGDFPTMIAYYKKGGRGVSQEFDLKRIEDLYSTEQRTGKNLSAIMLSGAEAEKVARSRELYKQLRAIYEVKKQKNPFPKLIADLILAEEGETEAAIEAVVKEKSAIVPSLIELMRNEEFYDPLLPGYGQAPVLATNCLGRIGDKSAIISLFEAIGEGDFFHEDTILDALHAIGEPAKAFLLKVLHGHPINLDNESAALALVKFKEDPEVSSACFQLLKELDFKKNLALDTYLILACEGLSNQKEREEFIALSNKPSTPKTMQQDMKAISLNWA